MLKKLQESALSLQGSIVRAGIFAIAWALFPFWLFFIVALYLFFIPVTQTKSVIAPFLAVLVLTAVSPVGFFMAAILGVLFWYILLIKELYLIDRRAAYEVLSFALIFLLFRAFYSGDGASFEGIVRAIAAFLIAILVGALFAGFVENFAGGVERRDLLVRRIAAVAASFLTFEFLLAGLFLPLDYLYQTAASFILVAVTLDLTGRYLLNGKLLRSQVFIIAGTAFTLLVVILGSARWGL